MKRRKTSKPTKAQPEPQQQPAAIAEPAVPQEAAPAPVEQPKPKPQVQVAPPDHWSVVPGQAWTRYYWSKRRDQGKARKDPLDELSPLPMYVDPKTFVD